MTIKNKTKDLIEVSNNTYKIKPKKKVSIFDVLGTIEIVSVRWFQWAHFQSPKTMILYDSWFLISPLRSNVWFGYDCKSIRHALSTKMSTMWRKSKRKRKKRRKTMKMTTTTTTTWCAISLLLNNYFLFIFYSFLNHFLFIFGCDFVIQTQPCTCYISSCSPHWAAHIDGIVTAIWWFSSEIDYDL